MKIDEWVVLAKSLRTAYPAQNFLADEYSIKLWYQMLKDLEYEKVNIAVHQYMLKEHFPPAIADIRRLAVSIDRAEIDWGSGYQEMIQSVHRYGYMQEKEALDSLSPITRKTVERLGWMNICCSSTDDEVANRANFRMIYQQIAEREKSNQMIPDTLAKKIEQMRIAMQEAEVKALEAREDEPQIETDKEYPSVSDEFLKRMRESVKM